MTAISGGLLVHALVRPCDPEAELRAIRMCVTPALAHIVFDALGAEHFVNHQHRKRFVFLRDSWANGDRARSARLSFGIEPLPRDDVGTDVVAKLCQALKLRYWWYLARNILEGIGNDNEIACAEALHQFQGKGRRWRKGTGEDSPGHVPGTDDPPWSAI